MFPSLRKLLLVALLFLFLASLPTSVQSQEPTPHFHGFLEMYTPEQYSVSSHTSNTESVTSSEGLVHWLSKQVMGGDEWGEYTTLLLDSEDMPHVVYYAYGGDPKLRYVHYDGVQWQVQTVDTGPYIHFSFDVDAAGGVHISYCFELFDSSCDDLKYAYYDGFSWQIENIDTAGAVGLNSSIAVDAIGRPHISYIDSTNSALKYAHFTGSVWQLETVDSPVYAHDAATSLALDVAGHPHIAYIASGEYVKQAYYDGTAWELQPIGDLTYEPRHISLVVDTNDQPHLAYYNQDSDLVYVYHSASGWDKQVVANCHFMHTRSFSLILDSLNYPHISYVDCENLNRIYTYYDGTAWRDEVIDVPNGVAAGMDLDSENTPSIAYAWYGIYYKTRINDPSGWSALTFASYRDMNFEIYIAQGDGTNPVRRTAHGATDYTPEFNRGATQIAFVSTRDGNPEIYTMRADGTQQTRLTANVSGDYLPTWSPDGKKIAFYSSRDGNSEIYVMNADGTGQTRLTAHGAWDGHPTWSPDGSKIAFVSDRTGGDELWTMNADGSNQKQLSTGLGVAAYPDWSPDGLRITFNDDANYDGWLDVAVINADGTGLFHPLGYSPASYDFMAPVWSPDGMYLAFARLQWINYYGNWYWVDSYIHYATNLMGDPIINVLGDSGYDWWPDWQTADVAAPTSQVFAPTWSETVTFTVQWQGSDVGLSGLRFYDVQYRDGIIGTWTDWLTKTVKTSALFTGEYGHTYYFRSRAYDYAGNVESYLADSDASTHVYRYALTGRVLANREQPVFAAVVSSTPAALNVAMTNHNGEFTLYFDDAGIFAIEASRNDFNILPPMKYISVPYTTAPLTFYLPPADDAITGGNFEDGNLTAWAPSGEIMPVLTSTVHTGDAAVMLGGSFASTMLAPSWRSIIQQEIEMPSPPTSATLSLLYQVVEAEPISDTLEVHLIGATQTLTYTLPLAVNHWEHRWWDLSTWDNPTLTLQIVWYQSEMTRTAGIILDEISLGTAIQGVCSVYLPLVLRGSR